MHVVDCISEFTEATCSDKFKVYPHHTACLSRAPNSKPGSVTPQEVVDAHNKYRGIAVSKNGALNMMKMIWDPEVAMVAQRWAENCKTEHDGNRERFIPGRFTLGQNLAYNHAGSMTWEAVVKLWNDEEKDFTYGTSNNKYMKVGHYTQLVWSESYVLGCGYSDCNGTHLYVCNYGPAGNSPSSRLGTPYEKHGPPCKSSDGNGLCECGVEACEGNIKKNHTTCACACPGSTIYTGTKCELTCRGAQDPSYCSISYTKDQCVRLSNVAFDCPFLCNVCPYAEKGYIEGSKIPQCVKSGGCSSNSNGSSGNGSNGSGTGKSGSGSDQNNGTGIEASMSHVLLVVIFSIIYISR
ncbi:cysteine-rich venom protein-like [Ostrea edulis]|uniref:cysteine-rich venom protein-like n=1 Tax=Ostrea edulis TaxID=37623 RepID=UPI0024AE8C6F|nr:cysteine-rich venom protein-like [Ostrea edulis]